MSKASLIVGSSASFPCMLQLLALAIRNGIAGSSATKSFKYLYDLLRPTRLTGSTKRQFSGMRDACSKAFSKRDSWCSLALRAAVRSLSCFTSRASMRFPFASRKSSAGNPASSLAWIASLSCWTKFSCPTDPTRGAHPTTAWLHSDAPPRLSFDGHSSTQDHYREGRPFHPPQWPR